MRLRVSLGTKRTGIGGEDALKFAVAAPLVDGRANAEIGWFLARLLGVPRSSAEVVRGLSGRDKAVFVRDFEASEVLEALSGQPR